MIAALRARVAHGLHGAPGMRGDHRQQQRYPLRRRSGRMEEGVQSKGPCQNPQRGFLSTYPEGTRHGWAVAGPVLDRTPESCGKALVAADGIRAGERVDEQDSGRLQNKLQIAVVVRGKPHLRPRTVGRDALASSRVLEPLGRKTAFK